MGQVGYVLGDVDRHQQLFADLGQIGNSVVQILEVLDVVGGLQTDLEGHRAVVDGCAQWSGDVLHAGDTGDMEDVFGDLVQHDHVGRVAHIVIGLDHEQFGLHAGWWEVPIRGVVSDVGRGVAGDVVAVVVVGGVGRQR